ncbi:MAG: hypothetical protein AVDCRST_MAG07-634, partial [uncultured Frankineae bacterium]
RSRSGRLLRGTWAGSRTAATRPSTPGGGSSATTTAASPGSARSAGPTTGLRHTAPRPEWMCTPTRHPCCRRRERHRSSTPRPHGPSGRRTATPPRHRRCPTTRPS